LAVYLFWEQEPTVIEGVLEAESGDFSDSVAAFQNAKRAVRVDGR
jgi:hypothetical protein